MILIRSEGLATSDARPLVSNVTVAHSRWVMASATDKKNAAQAVLMAHDEASRPTHLYPDINDCLQKSMRADLDEMEPNKSDSKAVCMCKYNDMDMLLRIC